MNFILEQFYKHRNFILFGIFGTFAFCVDFCVYNIFSNFCSYYIARAISFLCAVFFTWIFNRSITFKGIKFKGSIYKEFIVYLATMIVGGIANYSTFIVCYNLFKVVELYPVLGIASGSLSGLFINFAISQYVLYKK